MSRERKKIEDEKKETPSYMVSFGDMMTLMLTFFILLCTFAKEKRAQFIADGIGSFRAAVNSLGLPGLLPTDREALTLEFRKNMYKFNKKYPSILDDWEEVEEDQMDLSIEKLKASIQETMGEKSEVWLSTPVTFAMGETELREEHILFLRKILPLLESGDWKISIEGFGDKEETPDALTVSLKRAISVTRFIAKESRIDLKNITPIGMGCARTIAEQGAGAENRRVGIRITKD